VRAGRQWVVPAYLFLSLLIGGSAQGPWFALILELLGLAIIAWAIVEPSSEPMLPPARQLLWLAGAALLVAGLQLIPLPPSVWSSLGGRAPIADGFRALGLPLPWQPLSLSPYKTVDCLLSAIPPVAVLLGVVRLKASRGVYGAVAILAGTLMGVGLSALQLSSGAGAESPWYIYPVTNVGAGVGFFANANHMASLLLVSIPFLIAMVAAARATHLQRYSAFIAIAAAAGLLILFGIGLNGSLAAFGLVLPVCVASLSIIVASRARRRIVMIAAVFLAFLGVALLADTDVTRATLRKESETSFGSRAEILAPTIRLTREFFPFGSGVGTFRQVFAMTEDPTTVTTTYVNHAHNDYAEWIEEAGLPAVVLIVLFLAWWGRAALAVWRQSDSAAFARAASIASAVLLLHSIVDFPLRTSALASILAFCVALLADRRSPQAAHVGDLRPTRHIVIR
jgi:O-antigen ligase